MDTNDSATLTVDLMHVRRFDKKLADTIKLDYFRSVGRGQLTGVHCAFSFFLLFSDSIPRGLCWLVAAAADVATAGWRVPSCETFLQQAVKIFMVNYSTKARTHVVAFTNFPDVRFSLCVYLCVRVRSVRACAALMCTERAELARLLLAFPPLFFLTLPSFFVVLCLILCCYVLGSRDPRLEDREGWPAPVHQGHCDALHAGNRPRTDP